MVLEWGANWICGRPLIDGDNIVLTPGTLEPIDLYEREREAHESGRHDLAFELAAVRTPDDACGVARRYGLLQCGPGSDVFEEPVADWMNVSRQMRLVLTLALALDRDDSDRLHDLVATHGHHLSAEFANYDLTAKASVLVEALLNQGLQLQHTREAVISAVRVTQDGVRGPTGQWHFAPQFDGLIGYAFHRLAQTVSSRSPQLFRCKGCHNIFPRLHGNQDTWCGPTCKGRVKKRLQRGKARSQT